MSLDGDIIISLRQIVRSVIRILSFYRVQGEGGWQYVDPPWVDWIVIVQGSGDFERVERIGNATVEGDLLVLGEG